VSGAANADDHGKVATLVGNQAHYGRADRSAGRAEYDLFVRQGIGGVSKGRVNVGRRQSGVGFQQCLLVRAFRELADDQFHRYTRTPDDRLAEHHLRI
jgi:hypothetical protein